MLAPCQFFRCAVLHAERFGEYDLHLVHVLWCELAGLPRVMVHPVPYDMGVIVRLPCGFVIGCFVVFLVMVDEYLQGCDAPTLAAQLPVALQLLHCRIGFAHDNTLLDGRTSAYDGCLSGLLVQACAVFGLHCPSGLRLDHFADVLVILLKRNALDTRRYPRFKGTGFQ